LLDKANSEGAKILPIILSHCRFEETEILSKFQSVNDPNTPIISLNISEQEKVFLKLSREVEKILSKIEKPKQVVKDNDPLSHLNLLDSEMDNEPGVIELIEESTFFQEITTSIVGDMSDAVTKLGEKINIRTSELNKLNLNNPTPNIKNIKKIANKASEDLETYVKIMSTKIPDFEEFSSKSINSYSEITTQSKINFDTEIIDIINSQLGNLFKVTASSIIQTKKFKESIKSQPKMTTKFNRAKKRAVAITSDWISQLERYQLSISGILSYSK